MLLPRLPIVVAMVLILAGCSKGREPIVIQPAPAPMVAVAPPPAPPQVSPINRNLSPAATVWHLRVALNVAALACRGPAEATIIAGYNALLRGRATELAATQKALSDEYRSRGGDWQDAYDDAMTRLYNFFSQAQARDAFCEAASRTLAELPAVAPDAMTGFAVAQLPLLDAPFVQPLPRQSIALAAAPAPARAMAAPALAGRAVPVLKVDMRALSD